MAQARACRASGTGLNVDVAVSVSLGRMKSLTGAGGAGIMSGNVKEGSDGNQEVEQVRKMGDNVKCCEMFACCLCRGIYS